MLKGYESLELSTQMIIKEAINRGIKVEVLDWDDNFIRLIKDDKIEYLKQATRTSADRYISPLIMENKEVTKLILREKALNVPSGQTIKSIDDYKTKTLEFKGKDIVIKPKSTNFGQGVVILKNPYTDYDVKNAIEQAFKFDQSVLVEEFISGKEYRFLVIDDEVIAILHRVPANVTGDGKHTITELVEEKNKDPLRGKGYVTPLEKINLGVIEKEYLAFQGKDFNTIPIENEIVYLRENSNISTGGDSIDFTDDIINEYKIIAVEAAKAVGAKICGADIIINNIKELPNNDNYSIIELNFNPALHIHDFPYKGINRQAEKKVLDLLGF
ncbi:bifunctional glutamate--cysteine ligase GshA/glutathione synthetase GshB [Ruminiclostridium herbifermentans]|uniref:Bifunctional glutamate--cysteine ligase GshA/glutathione synthetase GshB n=1 Tax=Ruminiclostridium herbifermentans TaxID=2488810 RepID=A0A4U7JIZ6_9FIRM|nr:bifunctional glutamate--cysteine ligase GshA/glutathione synthetase GshB [Ruminiclostridium herbifermentans]QNU68650.1 bifunctional glutamate--cysteine ligase GshA/glutathione synthetase GshB [Ruminiclostridium herbifermentans]